MTSGGERSESLALPRRSPLSISGSPERLSRVHSRGTTIFHPIEEATCEVSVLDLR